MRTPQSQRHESNSQAVGIPHSWRAVLPRVVLLLTTLYWVCLPVLSFAQEGATEDQETSFQASSGASTQEIPGGDLAVGAYIIAFAALLLFVLFRLGGRQREVEASLATLEARLAPAGDSGSEEQDED